MVALAASPAASATPLELARRHISAVAAGDITKITADYTDQSWLSWVGGPLDGLTRVGPKRRQLDKVFEIGR